MNNSVFRLLIFFVFILYSSVSTSYTFGVNPQFDEATTRRMWDPFISYLNKNTGYHLILKTASSIPEFENNLSSGVYDFVYLNPLQYITYQKINGYSAFAKVRDTDLEIVLVSNINNRIKSLTDLKHGVLVFPYNSFAKYIITLKLLNENISNVDFIFVVTCQYVFSLIANELYDVGVGSKEVFDNLPNHIKSNLRIFWTSDKFTSYAFAANPHVPNDLVQTVKDSMLKMTNSNENTKIFNSIRFYSGFESAVDSDWDSFRALLNK